LKSESADDAIMCKEHEKFDPKCTQCQITRKSRRARIEDKMLYANQLYTLGLREYIGNLKRKRKSEGMDFSPEFQAKLEEMLIKPHEK